jgi:hypothetical protein
MIMLLRVFTIANSPSRSAISSCSNASLFRTYFLDTLDLLGLNSINSILNYLRNNYNISHHFDSLGRGSAR